MWKASLLTRAPAASYWIIFHYQEVYNDEMEYQNILATVRLSVKVISPSDPPQPRRIHDDFFRWLFGKQTLEVRDSMVYRSG